VLDGHATLSRRSDEVGPVQTVVLRAASVAARSAPRPLDSWNDPQGQQALDDADAVDIKVMGDRATAQVSLAGTTVPIELQQQDDGEWRFSEANEDALREALP